MMDKATLQLLNLALAGSAMMRGEWPPDDASGIDLARVAELFRQASLDLQGLLWRPYTFFTKPYRIEVARMTPAEFGRYVSLSPDLTMRLAGFNAIESVIRWEAATDPPGVQNRHTDDGSTGGQDGT